MLNVKRNNKSVIYLDWMDFVRLNNIGDGTFR